MFRYFFVYYLHLKTIILNNNYMCMFFFFRVQINLCNMVMNVLSYIIQRQNQLITNINVINTKKNAIIDLFYRIFKIFIIKLKQFQKFYLPQLNE